MLYYTPKRILPSVLIPMMLSVQVPDTLSGLPNLRTSVLSVSLERVASALFVDSDAANGKPRGKQEVYVLQPKSNTVHAVSVAPDGNARTRVCYQAPIPGNGKTPVGMRTAVARDFNADGVVDFMYKRVEGVGVQVLLSSNGGTNYQPSVIEPDARVASVSLARSGTAVIAIVASQPPWHARIQMYVMSSAGWSLLQVVELANVVDVTGAVLLDWDRPTLAVLEEPDDSDGRMHLLELQPGPDPQYELQRTIEHVGAYAEGCGTIEFDADGGESVYTIGRNGLWILCASDPTSMSPLRDDDTYGSSSLVALHRAGKPLLLVQPESVSARDKGNLLVLSTSSCGAVTPVGVVRAACRSPSWGVAVDMIGSDSPEVVYSSGVDPRLYIFSID